MSDQHVDNNDASMPSLSSSSNSSSSSSTSYPPQKSAAAAALTLPPMSTPTLPSPAQDTSNESSETKAHILAQQREVMLRRRQEGMRAEAVRSVEDPSASSSTSAASTSAYHTPGIKQFSTPQTEEDESKENNAKQSKRVVPMPQGPPPTSASRRIHSYRANLPSSSSFDDKKTTAPPKPARAPPPLPPPPTTNNGYESSDSEADDDEAPEQGSKTSFPSSSSSSSSLPPKTDDDDTLSTALALQSSKSSFRQPLDFASLLATRAGVQAFVTHPVPRTAGAVHCYIKRRKTGAGKLYPEYYLYTRQGDHFLMAAKKQSNNKTSNYHVTLNDRDFAKESPDYLGKLRANFVGTEFQLFDRGSSSSSSGSREKSVDGAGMLGLGSGLPPNAGALKEELGVVVYAANVLGARGPRKMQAFLPRVSKIDDKVAEWKESEDVAVPDAMLERVRRGDTAKFHHFINKPPRWNDQVGAYVLNFVGRVTMASVKNFQLIESEDHETVVLQFGRVGKHDFTMDVRWPFTPLQALGVVLSSFDSKIACD